MSWRAAHVLAGLLLWAAPGYAAETILLNEALANRCYQAALTRGGAAAVETCTRAIDHQPLAREDLAATYSNRGLLLARLGRIDEALADHGRAIDLAPEIGGLYVNRATSYVRAGRLSHAMEDLERAVEMNDSSLAAAHYNRALLFLKLGDPAAARADAERAVVLAPESQAYRAFAERVAEARALCAHPECRGDP